MLLRELDAVDVHSCIAEPGSGRRRWTARAAEQRAVYASRRRIRGTRRKQLQQGRGEKIERNFVHQFGSGGLRRLTMAGRGNVHKEGAGPSYGLQPGPAGAGAVWGGQARSCL